MGKGTEDIVRCLICCEPTKDTHHAHVTQDCPVASKIPPSVKERLPPPGSHKAMIKQKKCTHCWHKGHSRHCCMKLQEEVRSRGNLPMMFRPESGYPTWEYTRKCIGQKREARERAEYQARLGVVVVVVVVTSASWLLGGR